MTTAKWTISTRICALLLQELNEKGSFAGVGVEEVLEILLLQPSGPGYKRYFIPPHIHTFVLLEPKSGQRQTTSIHSGESKPPFCNRCTPLPWN
jgi:hypothetical protein